MKARRGGRALLVQWLPDERVFSLLAHVQPENLLSSTTPAGTLVVKIADFGLSKCFSGADRLQTAVGSDGCALQR